VGPERGRRPWAYQELSDKNYYVNFTTGVEIDSRVTWVKLTSNSLRIGRHLARDYSPMRQIVCKWLAGLTLRTAACILLVVVTLSSIFLLV